MEAWRDLFKLDADGAIPVIEYNVVKVEQHRYLSVVCSLLFCLFLPVRCDEARPRIITHVVRLFYPFILKLRSFLSIGFVPHTRGEQSIKRSSERLRKLASMLADGFH